MNTTVPKLDVATSSWWATRRLRYNKILLIAAPCSLVSLFLVWWMFEARLPCLEITGFSLMVGSLLFLVGLGIANLCYFLGPLLEKLMLPRDALAFRRRVFALGTGFSLFLIFFPVLGNLVSAAVGPAIAGQCG